MVTADEFQDAIEIEKGHVYFLCLRSEPPSTGSVHFFTFLQHYEPFFADFGPLNMASVYRFCRVLRAKKEEFPDRKVVYWCSHTAPQRANAVYLMGAYQVLVLGRSGEDAFAPFAGLYPPLLPFRDAQCGPSSFNLTVLDCLKGLRRAKLLGWADLETFDVDEYEFYERPEHGDFNWLVPGRFMAFSSPHDPPIRDPQTGAPLTMTPQEYFPLFRPRNVTTVVRLNGKATYDGRKFSDFGFAHHHLYFDDGSNPPDAILKEFLELSEAAPAAVAVHCKAGLGRTGTLIACYIMKHFRVCGRGRLSGCLAVVCRALPLCAVAMQFVNEGVLSAVRARWTRGARALRVLGWFRRPTHLFDSQVHVFSSCKRYYPCTYCTVSPYSFTHVSFMAACGHHYYLHSIKW